jgi:hypothetical protein
MERGDTTIIVVGKPASSATVTLENVDLRSGSGAPPTATKGRDLISAVELLLISIISNISMYKYL